MSWRDNIHVHAARQPSSLVLKRLHASKNIIQNAVNSKDHTTLVAAVKAGGLVDTLLKPENKATLDKVLTYHVVAGKLDSKALDKRIMDGGGRAELKTVEGGTLTVTGSGKHLMVSDAKGDTADVTIPNVYQSNGVIMVVNKVLLPNQPASSSTVGRAAFSPTPLARFFYRATARIVGTLIAVPYSVV